MIPVHEYADRDVAVFGLGRTGVSAAKALAAGGARVHAWDENEDSRRRAEVEGINLSDLNRMDWQGFACLVLSPGVPLTHPKPHRMVELARMTGVPVVGDVELFARAIQALPERARPKVVGITGTNGKSTTTALIGHILKSAGRDVRVGGNIGTGVLDLAPLAALSIYVVELSSYQLDLTQALHCDVSVFLNLSEDHLERHGTMDNYRAAKARIFRNQTKDDTAVIGVDSLDMQAIALEVNGREDGPKFVPVSAEFALGRGVSAIDGRLFDSLSGRSLRVGDLRDHAALFGRHNHQNVAAAYAACRALGLDAAQIFEGIESFAGLPHRLEFIAESNGVRFINDSKATNAEAAEQALKAFDRIYWIAGGQAKSDGIDPLRRYFGRVAKAYLIGEAEERFAATLDGEVASVRCGQIAEAVSAAYADAMAAGDDNAVILLSPACASFDQFRNFEERGDAFRSAVEGLVGHDVLQRA